MIWLLALTAVLFVSWLVASVALFRANAGHIRGWVGEARVRYLHLRGLDRKTYTVFHDVFLPRPDSDDTTEIDHIIVSRFGIFVIESKNVTGRISGSESDREWIVEYRSGGRRYIQNPLRQNHLHVLAVMKFLDVGATSVRSLVFFSGNCQLATKPQMGPDVIYRHGLIERITSYHTDVFVPSVVRRCIAILEDHIAGSDRKALRQAHIAQLQRRHPRPQF